MIILITFSHVHNENRYLCPIYDGTQVTTALQVKGTFRGEAEVEVHTRRLGNSSN